jgi:hypothetical protein
MREGTRLFLVEAAAAVKPAVQGIYGSYLPRLRDSWDRPAAPVYLAPVSLPDAGRYPTVASFSVRRDVRGGGGGSRNDHRIHALFILADLAALLGVCGSLCGEPLPPMQAA